MENRLKFSGGIFARDHKFAQSVRKHHKSQTSRKKILSTFQNNNLKTKHHNNGLALPASTYLDSAVTLGQRRKEVEKACCSLASVIFFSQEKKLSLSGPFHVKLFSGWQIATVVGMAPSPTWQHAAEAECSLPCKHRQSTTLSKIRMCKAPSFSWD